jgi:PASTA domain/Divergent InlB B-repeat domain
MILLIVSAAFLTGALSAAIAGSAHSTNVLVGPPSPAWPIRAAPPVEQLCDNTPAIVCLWLWPAGYGRIDATPEGGSTITCDYTTILDMQNPCPVPVPRGLSVTVAATAEPTQPSTFVHWSRAECPGTEPCTFTPAEEDEWVAAIFTPLTLEVGIEGEGTVEAPGLSPPPCPPTWAAQVCTGTFEAEQQVTLTATPTVGGTAIHWRPGFCEPEGGDYSSSKCTVTMTNIRTFASVAFGDLEPPFVPFQISVKVKVARIGSGHGRVTGSGIDCGASCSQIFGYQSRVTLKADAEAGSKFVRWVGVCTTDETCRFSAGSVTTLQARFDALPPPPPPPPAPPPPAPPPPPPPPPAPPPPPPPPPPPAARTCRVPNVVGQRLATARTRIRRANCSVGRIRYARSKRARGRVIAQSPRPGARRPRGAKVNLAVSRGRRR